MKKRTIYIGMWLAVGLCAGSTLNLPAQEQTEAVEPIVGDRVQVENLQVIRQEGKVVVDLDWNLDSLELDANRRMVFQVVITDGEHRQVMPWVVVNGRKQQIMYDRHDHKGFEKNTTVIRRKNGSEQTVHLRRCAKGCAFPEPHGGFLYTTALFCLFTAAPFHIWRSIFIHAGLLAPASETFP